MSDLLDAALLVIRAQKTRKSLLKWAMESMDKAKLKGLIVK
jgi:hypothetical protein